MKSLLFRAGTISLLFLVLAVLKLLNFGFAACVSLRFSSFEREEKGIL